MSVISYQCPKCSAEFKTDDSLVGEEFKCPSCGGQYRLAIPGVYAGMNLGGFIVERQLGVGGMGEVWLARQEKLDRHVALKILSPKYTSNAAFVERFTSEVRNTAKLEHPNIVTAFHAGVENGIYYMAISYICGETVFDRIKDGSPMSEKESLEIVKAVAAALDYAWSENKILHRDIKPSNIMLDKKSVPKLMDMGIAKSLDEESSLTMTGMMIGTPYYVSPEQAIGAKDIDFRADIYSLGATLYHMVTGNVPYDASTAMAIISKHLSEPLPDPRNYNGTLSEQIVSLIKIMMAKNKNDRQKSWMTVIEDIDRVLQGKFPLTPVPESNKTAVAPYAVENSPATEISPTSVTTSYSKSHSQTKDVVSSSANRSSLADENTKKDTESKRKKPNVFLLFLLFFILFVFLCITSVGAFLAYRYYSKNSEKRKNKLPTEIIVKPKNESVLVNPEKTQDLKSDDAAKIYEQSPLIPTEEEKSLKKIPEQQQVSAEKIDDGKENQTKSPLELPIIEPESQEKKSPERPRPNW